MMDYRLDFTQLKTPKLQQVCWHLVTTCYNMQTHIRMRSHGMRQLACVNKSVASFWTGLLQFVSRLVASWLFQQACCNLFQQVITSLQMTSCNKPDSSRRVTTWWNWQACCNLLTSCNKPVKLTTCNKSMVFLVVYRIYKLPDKEPKSKVVYIWYNTDANVVTEHCCKLMIKFKAYPGVLSSPSPPVARLVRNIAELTVVSYS